MLAPSEARLFKAREVAARLNCSLANVYALWSTGVLPFVCVGRRKGKRSTEQQIQEFLEARVSGLARPRRQPPQVRLKHLSL